MKKVKISELTGAALAYAVAECEGLPVLYDPMNFGSGQNGGYWIWQEGPNGRLAKLDDKPGEFSDRTPPFQNWLDCGEIIERESIGVWPTNFGWIAEKKSFGAPSSGSCREDGTTAIAAAMRSYVRSQSPDNFFTVPDELV